VPQGNLLVSKKINKAFKCPLIWGWRENAGKYFSYESKIVEENTNNFIFTYNTCTIFSPYNADMSLSKHKHFHI
jgi:hypothetical protein